MQLKVLSQEDRQFLSELAAATVDASRIPPEARVAQYTNTTGQTLIRPGGRDCYPAFWVRDFSMSLDCGLISRDEALHALRLTAKAQNGAGERRLKSGAIIPPHAIPDHVLLDGSPVFYPGTMSSAEDQGGEPFGTLPPADDHYEFIHIAHWLLGTAGSDPSFLREKVGEPILLERLTRAFEVPENNPSTGGMFHTTAARRAVGFGFYDCVHLTGSLLFPSLLRHRAALELADIFRAIDRSPETNHYTAIAESIASHIAPVFADPEKKHGWLYAATELGRQPDVWGTLYALHRNLLPQDAAQRARRTIAEAVTRGTLTSQAAVRHIPTDHDASRQSAWEKTTGVAVGTYQNGGYWHTPTGWLIEALHESHPDLAERLLNEYLTHLRQHDFRKGSDHGAPYECFAKDLKSSQNPVYMTSVTVPLAVLRNVQ